MTRLNKQSLREAFDTLKVRLERLCAEAKMAAESRALFEALLMQLEVLMGVLVQRRTVKDNSHSNQPSSQSPKEDNTATRPGAKGQGKTQNKVCRCFFRVRKYAETCCRSCSYLQTPWRIRATIGWWLLSWRFVGSFMLTRGE